MVLWALFAFHCSLFTSQTVAQTAKAVLDKTASVVSNKSGAKASFTIKGDQMNASGTIAIKGRKFQAATPQASIWFDGKTQWTYLKKNDEVNIATPSVEEQQAINPYNFINMYKNGYKYTMEKKNGHFIVHLTASGKKSISEMYITINQKSYVPSQVRYKTGKGWIIIDIRNFKAASLADGLFRFNAKDFPNAEVIDLR
ncbi:MAG: cell envelope biogenesis protein LolA [Prevotella sp.]|nr:cell envelope biogenesis protein LolA [Prevotella sp.]